MAASPRKLNFALPPPSFVCGRGSVCLKPFDYRETELATVIPSGSTLTSQLHKAKIHTEITPAPSPMK